MSRLRTRAGDLIASARKAAVDVLGHRTVHLRPEGAPKGSVLLSYITRPFVLRPDDPWFNVHSNMWECKEIAQTFLDMGYAVDVIDWDDDRFEPRSEYSVFVDIHGNLERLSSRVGKDCIKILHITGSHWLFQNQAEQARLSALQRRRGATLSPRRTVPPSHGIEHADFATMLGNDATAQTFAFSGKRIYQIPVSAPVQFPWDDAKDFGACRNSFLWMGSSGLVLRGLDLVLEAFAGMPDLRLTVCGPVDRERDFEEEYRRELYKTPNISTLGWVDTSGEQFRDVVHSSVALVYPSASEGQSTSVVTCMHAGLIPVISRESGVDVDGFGRILSECSIDGIRASVRAVSKMPAEELASMARRAWEYARAHHTREAFSREYRKAVAEILRSRSAAP